MSTKKTTVIVADSHVIFRHGIKKTLAKIPGVQVISEAESADSLLSQIDFLKPDIVILDLVLPGKGCFIILSESLLKYPKIIFIIISSFDDQTYVERSLYLGAKAFLKKDNLFKTLNQCLFAVIQNKIFVSSSVFNQCINVNSDDSIKSTNIEQYIFSDT